MAWRRPGDKPFPEPMMVSLLTHICITLICDCQIVRYHAGRFTCVSHSSHCIMVSPWIQSSSHARISVHFCSLSNLPYHDYNYVIMGAMAPQITGVSVVIQPFTQAQIKENIKLRVSGLCTGNLPVTGEFPHKGSVTRKIFPFDDVIKIQAIQPTTVKRASAQYSTTEIAPKRFLNDR